MANASKAELLTRRPRSEEVPIDGLEKPVRVRGLSLGGKFRYQKALTEVGPKGEIQMRADADYAAAAAAMLMECVVDDDWKPIFTGADEIDQLDPEVADKLFETARKLSGLVGGEPEKNS